MRYALNHFCLWKAAFLCLVLFLLVLSTGVSLAQITADYREGFVVNQEGDTLKGEIRYQFARNHYQQCFFKKEGTAPVKYTPDQIQAYGFTNGKHYRSGLIPGEFSEQLLIGTLSLFKYRDGFFIKDNRGEGLIIPLSKKQENADFIGEGLDKSFKFWQALLYQLDEMCGIQMLNQILTARLNEQNTVQLISSYNECLGSPTFTYKNHLPFLEFSVGPSYGIGFSSLVSGGNRALENDVLSSYFSTPSHQYGAKFSIRSPRVYDPLALQVEVRFYTLNVSQVGTYASGTPVHITDIQFPKIGFPISVRHQSQWTNQISVYSEMGLYTEVPIQDNSYFIITEQQDNQLISTPVDNAFRLKSIHSGPIVGVGLMGYLGSRLVLQSGIRYSYIYNLSATPELTLSQHTIDSFISIQLR